MRSISKIDETTRRADASPGHAELSGTVENVAVTDPELLRGRDPAPRVRAAFDGMDGEYPEQLLRLDRPDPGPAHLFIVPMGDQTMVSARFFLYGDRGAANASGAARAWTGWLAEHFGGEGGRMIAILRTAAAIGAGVVVVLVIIVAVEVFSSIVHPVPHDFGGTPEELARHVEIYPTWLLAVAVPAWGLAAMAGTWTAGSLGFRWCGVFVGFLLVSALVVNIAILPYPIWFKAACLIVIPAAVVFGYRKSDRRAPYRGAVSLPADARSHSLP